MKGISAYVLRSALGDCTNGGVTKFAKEVVLVGEGIPELTEATEERPALRLVRRMLPNSRHTKAETINKGEFSEVQPVRIEYLHAEPVEGKDPEKCGWMAGGNFIHTSDSRFPSQYPISVHDRQEVYRG